MRVPHVYDMGNELAVVARNYGLGDRHPITRLAAWAERRIVRSSDVVIAHFPAHQDVGVGLGAVGPRRSRVQRPA